MEEYLPKYRSSDEGVIVNISSTLGFEFTPVLPVYTATKHAIIGLTKSFGTSAHYEMTKVKVVAICPGATDTPLLHDLDKKAINERYLEIHNKGLAYMKEVFRIQRYF